MITTVYLIRHSIRFNRANIETYNTNQNMALKNEKIILSVEGEKRSEILSKEDELQNLDVVYTSNCVRTLQTAKYILENQNLKANIDERFDERRVGIPNDDTVKDWYIRQYIDDNYKTEGGESQLEVRNRFSNAINDVLNKYKGKRIAIFTHELATTFYLKTWCELEYNYEENQIKLTFNDKTLITRKFNAPEVFKLEFNDKNEIIDINNIEFNDLPYKDGMGIKI